MGDTTIDRGVKRGLAAVCAAAALSVSTPALAQTAAGTTIVNIARLTASSPSTALDSNAVALTIGAIVDAAIVADRASQPLTAQNEVGFTIRNPGNAADRFTVEAVAGERGPAIAVDVDGDGRIDDTERRAASVRPVVALPPGGERRILVLVGDVPVPLAVTATVTAARGHGAPGTALEDDAVIGASGAQATATTRLTDTTDAARFDKTQAVRAPDGSTRAVPGAVITYTLVAQFVRDVRNARIADMIPAGTAYVPGSITIDSRPATDPVDGDAAQLDAGTVRVALGDVPAAATRTITFQAIIQ